MAGLSGAYEEPQGKRFESNGPQLVKVLSAEGTRAGKDKSGNVQILITSGNSNGQIGDFLPGSVAFRIKQYIAALSGKVPEDISSEVWDKMDTAIGDTTTPEGATRLAEWVLNKKDVAFWVNIKDKVTQNGQTVKEVDVFKPGRVRLASETEKKEYKAPAVDELVPSGAGAADDLPL